MTHHAIQIMYVVASSYEQNPSNFVFTPENALDLNDNYEVGVKSVSHAPSSLANVTAANNHFIVLKNPLRYAEGEKSREYSVPPGFYRTSSELLLAMREAISRTEQENSRHVDVDIWEVPEYTADEETHTCSLSYSAKSKFVFVGRDSGVIRYFRKFMERASMFNYPRKIAGKMEPFDMRCQLGYIYSNIVPEIKTSSNNRTRFLALFPFNQQAGYNHYEFVNPSYFKVNFTRLSEMYFSICDNMGQLFEFSESDQIEYPTVIVLHFRKISN